MPQCRHTSLIVTLTLDDARTLTHWHRQFKRLPAGQARRGRIVQLMAQGLSITEVARRVGQHRRFVYKWVARYQAEGLDGLRTKVRARHKRSVC